MSIRIVLTTAAAPGKASALAAAYAVRCAAVMHEPGCEQFEVSMLAVAPTAVFASSGMLHAALHYL